MRCLQNNIYNLQILRLLDWFMTSKLMLASRQNNNLTLQIICLGYQIVPYKMYVLKLSNF